MNRSIRRGKKYSASSRILVRALFACGGLCILVMILVDGANRLSLIQRATGLKLSETVPGTVAISPGAHERNQIIPTSGIDGKWWVMHTEQMLREGTWRVRHTDLDNNPAGREVHWSSGLMWLLVAMSWVIHLGTMQPMVECVPCASLFAGPVMLIVGLVFYGLILASRYGWKTGAVGVLFFSTSFPVFEYFRLGDCDHHGLVGWFAMIGVLCLAAGGAGCIAPKNGGSKAGENFKLQTAGRWFITSGIAGAAALWVSAATQIPILLGTALGAVMAGFVSVHWQYETLRPELWRLWGRAGCLASLFFYALEYFPFHMGWRLEVNHPVYALAWLGGSEILYRLLRKKTGQRFVESSFSDWFIVSASIVLLLVPPLLIAFGSAQVFWVADRFLLTLHNEHIREFKPFFVAIQNSNIPLMLAHGLIWPALGVAGLVVLFLRRSVSAQWVAPLILTIAPCLVMLALAMKQIRWIGIALGLWTLLATLIVAMCMRRELARPLPRWSVWGFCCIALIPIALHPALALGTWAASQHSPEKLPKDILPNVVARDVVHRLIEANPHRMPVVLSGPTTATELAYYGGAHVLGTLYWENMPGLKAAAHIFSATTASEAKASLAEHKVNYVLLFSWDEFSKDYENLLAIEAGKDSSEVPADEMFVTRLLKGTEIPQWVRPLYYPIPPQFELEGETVRLFEIVPDQTLFDSYLNRAIYHLDSGELNRAEEMLSKAEKERAGDVRISQLRALLKSKKIENIKRSE
ncbi:MAG: hypothetical protein ABI615_02940 [Chthoniobacterales bacterium]